MLVVKQSFSFLWFCGSASAWLTCVVF